MVNALKKINARAKQLKKKHPNAKYKTLQKQAGREYKAGKLKEKRKPATTKLVKRKAARRVGATKKANKKALLKKGYRVAHTTQGNIIAEKNGRSYKAATMQQLKKQVLGGMGTRLKQSRKAVKKATRRKVSGRVGKKTDLMPILLIGGLAAAAYFLLRPAQVAPPLYQTGNQQRNNAASNILAYATAAGLTLSAIAQLVKALNSSDDSTVIQAGFNPAASIDNFLSGD